MSVIRIDQLLVQRQLAPTRSAAQRLLASGSVRWRSSPTSPWQVPGKAGASVPLHAEIDITDSAELKWASRGGLKLEGALAHTQAALHGLDVLDLGQSTGGFTDVVLHLGARSVTGVEVGHGQLIERLRQDPRVACLEGFNARHLSPETLIERGAPLQRYDFIVGDLSFISLGLVLPGLMTVLAPGGQLLLLIKPQFELQAQDIGKGGLVRAPDAEERLRHKFGSYCTELKLQQLDFFQSPLQGGDGNTEYFLHAQR